MARVLHRCLDCDCTFAVTSACPRCGSTKTLILSDDTDQSHGFAQHGAWLFIAHAVLLTLITPQAPGSVLGTLLFGVGLSGALILVGTELATRIARACAVLLTMVELLFAIATGQILVFFPGAMMTLAGLLLLHEDTSASWLPTVRWLGWTIAGLLLLLTAIAAVAGPLPGWWTATYLPWTALSQPPTLPAPPSR
jgi:hypothetical protein